MPRMAGGAAIWRERVAEAIGEGAPLAEIETELIEPAPLPEDLRDALWLYAWGLSEERADGQLQRFARS